MDQIVNIICALPAVIIAFTVHEYAHARVADALGDPTPRMMGRLTLDPFAHIDWVGMACMLLVGFGWAKPVQVRSGHFKKPRRDAMLVAVAGPLSNLFLAVASLSEREVFATAMESLAPFLRKLPIGKRSD